MAVLVYVYKIEKEKKACLERNWGLKLPRRQDTRSGFPEERSIMQTGNINIVTRWPYLACATKLLYQTSHRKFA